MIPCRRINYYMLRIIFYYRIEQITPFISHPAYRGEN